MADSTLQAIRTKVRRITRSPAPSQLTDAQIDEYVNTFILYDFPSTLRLFSLRTTLTFYTQPGVDVYQTNTTDLNDALYNFKNKYIAVHQPVFMAGVQSAYTQWRDSFYAWWPQTNTIQDTQLRGDGTTGPFTGTLSHAVLQNSLIFSALDTGGTAMILVDYPVSNTSGALGRVNEPQVLPSPYGSINYLTGDFSVVFPNNTQIDAVILAEMIVYQPGKPVAMLYYDNKFTLRPVPDKVYPIQIEADIRPTELLDSAQIPELEQWWQYVSLGASRKVFEDRMDTDSLQQLMPIFKDQENMVNRTSLTQQANMRSQTIYTNNGNNYGFGWWNNATWPF